MEENPITDICIISEPLNCPGGYIILDKTHDKKEDADLWKDTMWKKRTLRYLCFQTSSHFEERDVLVNVTVINDRDPVPHGFACLEFTVDTKDRAIRKRQICVRYIANTLTQDAISDLVFVSRGKRPPPGYTLGGELNNLQICFKMSALKLKTESMQTSNAASMSYTAPSTSSPQYGLNAADPNMSRTGTHHKMERAASKLYNPMSGVPWQLNPRLDDTTPVIDGPMPDLDVKSYEAIDNKYSYSFQAERNAIQQSS